MIFLSMCSYKLSLGFYLNLGFVAMDSILLNSFFPVMSPDMKMRSFRLYSKIWTRECAFFKMYNRTLLGFDTLSDRAV